MLFTSIICLLVLSSSLPSYGFNLDLESALIFSPPPGSESKYFGYSVALHSFRDKYWAIVGAPLSNGSSGADKFTRYGSVYRCEYTGSQSCSSIDIDNTQPKDIQDYGYCEAGFSAEYMKDPPYNVIMGAVGSRRWTGAVMMVDPDKPFVEPIKTTQDQIDLHEYNGYSIASGLISVQSRADVVSGAPRADSIRGKALIYKYESGQFSVRSQLPQPKDLHGILNLLDTALSGDNKYNAHFDVAIGAPMEGEDGSGAVYIYHGSSNGIKQPYSQKIVGSLIHQGIKMFGISVAGNVDMDKNGYPDIVVGAYASDKAVLIRTKSLVSVGVAITLSEQQITLEGNDSSCDLDGKRYDCVNVTVNLNYVDAISSPATSDLHLTFTFDLDKDINVQLRRMFFYDEVTKSKVVFLRQNTTLAQPNTTYEVLRKTAYIKSKDELGDLTSLLPFDVTLSQPQPPCANNMCPILNDRMAISRRVTIPFAKKCRSRVICEPDLKSFGIKFSPGSVREDFVVQVETSSQNKDANIKDNKKTISVAVKYEADVEITGTTKQDQVVYQGPVRSEEEVKKDLDSIGPEIVQTLSVRNNGPSDLRSSEVVVNFPKAYSSSKPDSFLLYLLLLDGASGICDASVNPLKIKELDSPKAVELVTSAKIKTAARPARTAAQEKKTPWWIILLSVLGGLLLVAAVIAILYKVSFGCLIFAGQDVGSSS
ncbi:Integrin alpha-4 [Acropora cervicornis]|uniref:Integrin alpha-4 n=1 Tax=Acropora cervicornis TaxID=6130 RepID=A0AAD9QZ40_ACRCE|nr:Integrin alpha-4 [Acropora cervicornis]